MRLFLASLSLLVGGGGETIFDVSIGAVDAQGASVYSGGPGGMEISGATLPITISLTLSAQAAGAMPGEEGVPLSSISATAPGGSTCAVGTMSDCTLGVCSLELLMDSYGACAFNLVGDSDNGKVSGCYSLVLTDVDTGGFEEADAQALALCGE